MARLSVLPFALVLLHCGVRDNGGFLEDAAADSNTGDGAADAGDGGFIPPAGAYLTPCTGDSDCGGGGQLCCSNVCAQTASCSFALTGLSTLEGWQSGEDWVALTGAGFAKGMRAFVGGGRAPLRVIDSSHATMLTPPGTTGVVEVKIQIGAAVASLLHAFEYKSGGLTKQWVKVTMNAKRGEAPGLAVLRDGRVLVTGGSQLNDTPASTQDTAELFDRPTTTFAKAGNTMSAKRWWNSAVTLLTGKVLVVGGACTSWWQTPVCVSGTAATAVQADVFDPGTNKFAPTASPLNVGRSVTLASLLVDGRVLIASMNDPSVEIYDPDTDSFKLVAHAQPHGFGFMTRLRDGRVLLGGGTDATGKAFATVEAFDSDTNTFTVVGQMISSRGDVPSAVALPDGALLVAGGADDTMALASIERFDPMTNKFSLATYALSGVRLEAAGVLVRDGTILVAGGIGKTFPPPLDVVDQIDPVNGKASSFPSKPIQSTELSGIRLHDGSVLLAGGVTGIPNEPASDFIEFLASDTIK